MCEKDQVVVIVVQERFGRPSSFVSILNSRKMYRCHIFHWSNRRTLLFPLFPPSFLSLSLCCFHSFSLLFYFPFSCIFCFCIFFASGLLVLVYLLLLEIFYTANIATEFECKTNPKLNSSSIWK